MSEATEHEQAAIQLARSEIPLWGLAHAFAGSGYFSDVRKVSQALVKIAAGQELGFGPMASVTGIHVVDNEIMIGANMCAALVRREPDWDYRIVELSDEVCRIRFLRLEDGKWVEQEPLSEYTIDNAKQAGIYRPRSGWDRNPRNMLFARSMTNGVKWHCPHLTGGVPLYSEGDYAEAEFRLIDNGEEPIDEEPEEADVQDAAKRLENQWEEPVVKALVDHGFANVAKHAVHLLNRSPFKGVEYGALKPLHGLAWAVCWTLAKEELPKDATSDEVQVVALRNWGDKAKREGYRTLAQEKLAE